MKELPNEMTKEKLRDCFETMCFGLLTMTVAIGQFKRDGNPSKEDMEVLQELCSVVTTTAGGAVILAGFSEKERDEIADKASLLIHEQRNKFNNSKK